MADKPDVKQLLLEVDASVELLRRNLTSGDTVVANFERTTQKRLDDLDRRFTQFGKGFANVGPTIARTNAQIGTIGVATMRVQHQVEASTGAIKSALLASAAGFSAAFAAHKLKEYTDSFTTFTNQLKVAGLEGSRLADTQDKLFGIAQKYGVELESVGVLYGRNAAAAKELGLSQKDQLKFVSLTAAALKANGSSAESARGALLQLSQMLGGSKVQATEFNSLVDGARPLLQAAANGSARWGGSIAKLTADVKAGTVWVKEFVAAILAGGNGLFGMADKTSLTLGASFTVLNNALGYYIAQTNKGLSATEKFGEGIRLVADNLNIILPALVAIGAGYAVVKTGKLAFDAVSGAVATAMQADRALAAEVLKGNASFVDRASMQAKIAVAAREAATAEVASIEATLAAQREEAAQLEANLALIREQRAEALRTANAIRASQAAGFGTLGQGGATRTSTQLDAGRALKAEKATATALAAANAEVARSEAALATAQATRATATVAAAEATKAATFAAKAGSAAAALFAGALSMLTAALPIIAIGAMVAAVLEYRRASTAGAEAAKRVTEESKELANEARRVATNAHAAADGIDAAGSSAAANTAKMLRFAGAVGDAAQKLRDLATERHKQAIEAAKQKVADSQANVDAIQSSVRASSIAGAILNPLSPAAASKNLADAWQAQQKLDEANKNLATRRQQLADTEKRAAESYIVASDRTGGRDLNAELDRINNDLLLARRAGNKEQINDLEAEKYERKQTLKYLGQKQSFEAASAQASKDAAKFRAAGQAKLDQAASAKGNRNAVAAVKDEANDTRAYKAAERQANDQIAQANAELAQSAAERVQIEKDRIEASRQSKNEEIEQQGKAGRYTKERVIALQKLNDDAARKQTEVVDVREMRRAAQEQLDVTLAGIDAQRDILQDQSSLATTAKERRAVELRLLDLQYKEEKLRLERILAFNSGASDSEKAVALVDYNTLDARYGTKKAVALKNTQGPGEQFLDSLDPKKVNENLEQVKVDGLKGLEDGLVGVLDGTKSVSAAFKDMAQSILSDLARIAIQQMIIKPLANSLFGGTGFGSIFGHADGGLIKGYAGGGAISGPGGPRSDSILAAVSNGEFIVNAEATRKNLALLHAINDKKLPRFANGGPVTPSLAIPRVPDLRGMGGGRIAGTTVEQHFDLRGAVVTEKLYADMKAMADQAATRGAMGGAQMAQERMARSASRKLGR